MKIIMNYDQATGQLTNHDGVLITTYMGMNPKPLEENEAKPNCVDDLVKLKAAGFTADEIMAISARGLV